MPFLFSVTGSLSFALRQAFENASFSAWPRGAWWEFLRGTGKEGVEVGQEPDRDTPSCKESLSDHRTLKGFRFLFPSFVGIIPSPSQMQVSSLNGYRQQLAPTQRPRHRELSDPDL